MSDDDMVTLKIVPDKGVVFKGLPLQGCPPAIANGHSFSKDGAMGGLLPTMHGGFTPYFEVPLTLNGELKQMENVLRFIQDFTTAGFLTHEQGTKCCREFIDAANAKEKEISFLREHAICTLKECSSFFATVPFEHKAVELCNSTLDLLQHPKDIFFDMYPDLFKIADEAISYGLLLKSRGC